jgi:ATP-dependent Clp protease ATP-binding subunit ClpA
MFEGFLPMEPVESRFTELAAAFESRIVDQPEAINAVIDALERSETRLPNDKRPIANFAFLGPTGVGKSEMAKTMAEFLAQILGNGDVNLIKIDCSNFSHKSEIAVLTGSAPGYIDGDITPRLAKENVEKEGTITVVLWDEIEKGCPELYNLMLQIMGDGELTMSRGELTSFKNSIHILTSNLGAKEMADKQSDTPLGFAVANSNVAEKGELDKTATKAFKKFFAPEFINRLDEMIVFHPLSEEGLGKVLDVKLDLLNVEYERHYGVRLSLSDAVKAHLVEKAKMEPENGARPLVRALEKDVLTIFGRNTNGGNVPEGTHVRVFHTSEAPANYSHTGKSPLIFTSKADANIKKERYPLALPMVMYEKPVAETLPVNPQDYYDIKFEPKDYKGYEDDDYDEYHPGHDEDGPDYEDPAA